MVKPGMFIGDRYEILDKIGTGGMADVYKAKCHRLNRLVAIKILKQEYSEDKKFVDKFRGEAQSVAGLSHPNIVNVYDVGEDDGLYYIVMELVQGITLKNFIERKGTLEIKEATGIAIQIALGLEAAHASHIIHRDIKPQNIIISKEGKVKVTDFGIAKAATSNTITSNAMGSVHYISPEQARGGYSDEKSDIYSLGVTMYEMLTGQVPFSGDNTVAVALSHIQDEAASIRTLNPSVSASLDKIVQKCMQKKPERRYLAVTSLIEDLKRSISEPAGDFVQLVPSLVDDSPTINLSEDEVNTIRQAVKHTSYPVKTTDEKPVMETTEAFEEEKEQELDPKLEKIAIIGGSVAAVILVIVIIVLIVKAFNMGTGGDLESSPSPSPSPVVEESPTPEIEGITVDKYVGETKEIAEGKITEAGLVPNVIEEASEFYPEGVVAQQNPAQGEVLQTGDKVDLYVSTGPAEVSVVVPETHNYTLSDAQIALTQAGLMVSTPESEYSDTIEEGKVIRTEPAANTTVERDTYVKIITSKGKEIQTVTVPDLTKDGYTEETAKAKLIELGLMGNVSKYEYDSNVKEGNIISQSHSAGTQVEKGTTINFVVSLGPEASYKYVADFTVSDNPFEYEDEEGTLKIVLLQDGKSFVVTTQYVDYFSFPLPVSIEGKSESVGEISLYIDDVKFGSTYSVSFTKVKQ